MAWKNLFRKPPSEVPEPEPDSVERPRTPSLHLAQAIERRSGERPPVGELSPRQRRREGLLRQRTTLMYDLEQGETAAAPDNPWTQHIALLGEALGTVDQDLARVSTVTPGLFFPMPHVPIAIGSVTEEDDAAVVTFAVGDIAFAYAEEPDWADRSRLITRGDLRRKQGDPSSIVPETTPENLRDALAHHLDGSLLTFASDLRDRMLDAIPLPESPNLAELSAPCPICGGWTDWRGTCQACAQRQAEIAALKREQNRLLDERNREAEERHRLIEGIPLARRRLHEVDEELARLESS